MNRPVIASAVRTPIARARRGSLVNSDVFDLAEVAVTAAIERAGIPSEELEDLALGEVMQGGGVVARYIANQLGLHHVPGVAVQRACASGMQAVNQVGADIAAGMVDVAVAGGAESMSTTPTVFRPGDPEPWISPTHPETPEAPNLNMGVTVGENTAAQYGISRAEQDHWAYHSHQRALSAIEEGRFDAEVVPVPTTDADGRPSTFTTDEHPRADTTLERLAGLPALFQENGTVTAGNASGINDGAAAMVMVSEEYARTHDIAPLAYLRSWAAIGVPPARTGSAPMFAIPKALERAGLTADDIGLVEINEAFASMAVACTRELGFTHDQVNVNGGAVGLGHPVACSGARIMVTLIHELRRRGGGYGVAALCAGGGMGVANVIEVPSN